MQGQYNLRNPAVKRLMREAQELSEPTEQFYAQPLEDNLFEWHFTIRGPFDSDFDGGIYHGRIVLPPEYPMKPPSIILLTPNGRFEIFKKICLSISGHHPESWQPSWSIRTALLAIIGFMPTHGNGAIGSLDYTPEERKKLARRSNDWKCGECGSVKDILKPVTEASKKDSEEAKELASQINFQGEKEKNSSTADSAKPATETSASSPPSAAPNLPPPFPGFNAQMFAGFPMATPSDPASAAAAGVPLMPPYFANMMANNNTEGNNNNPQGLMPPFWPPAAMMFPGSLYTGTNPWDSSNPDFANTPSSWQEMMESWQNMQQQFATSTTDGSTGGMVQPATNSEPIITSTVAEKREVPSTAQTSTTESTATTTATKETVQSSPATSQQKGVSAESGQESSPAPNNSSTASASTSNTSITDPSSVTMVTNSDATDSQTQSESQLRQRAGRRVVINEDPLPVELVQNEATRRENPYLLGLIVFLSLMFSALLIMRLYKTLIQ